MNRFFFFSLCLFCLFCAACSQPTPSPTQISQLPTRAFTATRAPSATPSPLPTATVTPSATPTATPTLHPLTLASMRQRTFPGSELAIEETLKAGANYQRYRVSYLSDGLKIYALLTVPNGVPPETGWPGIVFNHGYIPPTQYRTTERYIAYVDWIARSGYVVLRPDYRGHDQSEGVARGAYSSPDYVIDVLNATTSLKNYPGVDRQRIGLWGHSMGGYITLRAMVIDPEIKAGVIWAGVVGSYADMLAHWRRNTAPSVTATPRGGWRGSLVAEYGSPEENPEFWASISANTYLSELGGPLQLHHGTKDADVPLILSELLNEQMMAAGQTVEFYTYEGDNHNLSNSFSLAMRRTIKFFDAYVKGEDE